MSLFTVSLLEPPQFIRFGKGPLKPTVELFFPHDWPAIEQVEYLRTHFPGFYVERVSRSGKERGFGAWLFSMADIKKQYS